MKPEDLYNEDDKPGYIDACKKLVAYVNANCSPDSQLESLIKDAIYELRNNYGD